jgi:hypothetical protein
VSETGAEVSAVDVEQLFGELTRVGEVSVIVHEHDSVGRADGNPPA